VHAAVRGVSAPLHDDRPLRGDVEAVVALLDAVPGPFAD
jgi:histidine ammonia-lyase